MGEINTEDICEKFDRQQSKTIEEKKFARNGEGFYDQTAYAAMKNHGNEEARFYKLLYTIFYIVKLAGFELDGRIKLIDRRTGRVWE
jgi:hypothetical protein